MTNKEKQRMYRRMEWITSFCLLAEDATRTSRELAGLNLTQTRILFHVALYTNKPIGKIASALCLKASTTTAAITGMESRGLIKRTPNPNDHRSMTVALTKKGYGVIPKYINGCSIVLDRLLSHVQDGKQDALLELILPKGPAAMIEDYCDENIDEKTTYERLHIDPKDDPKHVLFVMVLYIERVAYFLNELGVLDSTIDLSLNEARTLRYLALSPNDTRLKEIRGNLHIKTNVMSVCLDRLQEAGFIDRITNTEDRRAVIIHLEDKGKTLIEKTSQNYRTLVDNSFPAIADTPLESIFASKLFVL